jgi:Holliday junction resolvase
MPNPKNTGKRYERELVKLLRQQGFKAERVYGSGAVGTILKGNTQQALEGDVYVPELNLTIEVKYRSNYPCWLRELQAPIGIEDTEGNRLLVMPGSDLRLLLRLEVDAWTRSFDTTWFLTLMGKNSVLAVRMNRVGWVLVKKS